MSRRTRRQVSMTETPSEEGGSKRARRASSRVASETISRQQRRETTTPQQEEESVGSIVDVSISDGEEEHVSLGEDASNEMDTGDDNEEGVDDVEYRKHICNYFIYRRATEAGTSCIQCSLSVQKNEDVLAMPHPQVLKRHIHGHERPLEDPEVVHLQCTDQTVTHYKGYVAHCHKNFLDSCVLVKTDKGYLPLSHVPEKYEKLEKIFEKNFYSSSDAVRNVPKAFFDKDYQITAVNEDTSDLSEGGNVISDEEEEWILQKILNTDEILDPNSLVCDEKDCTLLACTQYVQSTDMNNIWNSCIDCQKQAFGGWPSELQEFPVEFIFQEDLDTMKSFCTKNKTFDMPTILPIKTSNGELVNASNNEIDSGNSSTNMSISEGSSNGFGVPEPDRSVRPKAIIELSLPARKKAIFKLQVVNKRNAPDDNIFFCSKHGIYKGENCCKGILTAINPDDVSDASKVVYRVKCNVAECKTHRRGTVRFICKICNSQFRGHASTEIKCQHKNLEFCPYMTTQYIIDMNGLDINSTFEILLSDPSSPMYSLFQTHTVFELGATTNKVTPCDRLRRKMGIIKSANMTLGLFHRRLEHFQRMEAVCIWFKNVLSQDGEDTSKICEKAFFDKLIHYHHGTILSVPAFLGMAVPTKKNAFGLEECGLYIIAAEPSSQNVFKQDLRKGRMGREKELALYKRMIEAEKVEAINHMQELFPEHTRAVEEQGEVIALQTEKLEEQGEVIALQTEKLEEHSMVVEEQGEAIALQTAKLEEMETKIEQLATKVDEQHDLLKQIAIRLGTVRIGDNND